MATTLPSATDARDSGLPTGAVRWGSHLCQFYRSREDLIEILVPYFAAGLAASERCLWIASEPLPAAAAREALARVVPDLEARERRGQIEILDYTEWYLRAGQLSIDEVVEMWLERERAALREGFAGLRLTGNTAWLEAHQWTDFAAYEDRVHHAFHGARIIALCSYSLDKCGPNEIIDVLRHHGGALVRRDGRWDRIESATAALAVTHDHAVAAIRPHSVEFYPDRFPALQTARSISAALRSQLGAGALARRTHLPLIEAALRELGIDVVAVKASGQLVMLDADAVFEEVSTRPGVDLERLDEVLGTPVRALVGRTGRAWLCGELVDLFCRAGDHAGAVTLEEWWNTQIDEHAIELHCAYAVESFTTAHDLAEFRQICDTHTRVQCDPSTHDTPRLLAELQQVSSVLQSESGRRVQLETAYADAREHLVVLQRVTQELSKAVSSSAIEQVVVAELRAVLGASSVDLLLHGEAHPAVSRNAVNLPLTVAGRRLGSIILGFSDGRLMSPALRGLADDVAKQVAVALDRARWYERAEQASRAKDEFLAMLGHELRNPLSPILTATQLMKLRSPDALVKERTTIERQVRHMVRLVDDLLDISRVTRGTVKLERTTIELAQVVAQAVELASPALEERSHQLDVSVPSIGLTVDVDPHRLAQVLTNLLVNAAKYTPPRGAISLHAEANGATVSVRVVDNGRGIAPELLPRVFEMFVQARQNLDRAAGGLGVGLAIARTLVELHGGTIMASSAGEGKGSTFTVELPRPVQAGSLARTVDGKLAAAAAPQRLLIVDDNRDAAMLFADALRMLGHEVDIAHDGPSALAFAKTNPPDICFLDIGLPVMDGYELCRRLSAQQVVRPRLIAVTGYGQASDRAESERAGFDHHFVKPVNLREVADLIARPLPTS